MSRRSLTVALFVAFVLSTCSFLQGQSTYGAITGSVTDPSGAAITDAKVTLTNLGTAETRTQPTSADGLYSFVNLIPGNYKIDVEKPGFKRITRTPIVVEVQQSAKIRSEEHTSELQSHSDLVCRLLLEKKKEKERLASH